MGTNYKVTVPFGTVTYNLLGTSMKYDLPDHLELPEGVTINRNSDRWIASISIEAPSSISAQKLGISAVSKILSLFAIHNAAFQVVPSKVTAEKFQKSNQKTIEDEGDNKYINLIEEIKLKDQLDISVKKNDFTLEIRYLSSEETWSQNINSAIELNYLAVTSNNPSIKFLLLISALEGLSYGKFGSIKSILSEKFKPREKKIFINEISRLLKSYNIPDEEIDRITNNTLNTQRSGIKDHLFKYLKKMGIKNYSKDDVTRWWKHRTNLVHGNTIKYDYLLLELNKLADVVQRSIRIELGE